MLGADVYEFRSDVSKFHYEFESIGPKGAIEKLARFSEQGLNFFSFGFADIDQETGTISDTIVSNNGDSDKVLFTVAAIINDFMETYPQALVYIEGSTIVRTRKYQMGISKHLHQIQLIFDVFGMYKNNWEPFEKNKNYSSFCLCRKGR